MKPSLAVGGALTGLLVGTALLSLAWTPYSPTALDILHKLSPPSAAHPLGSDSLGRDVLSMIMAGARNSIAVGDVLPNIAAVLLVQMTIQFALGIIADAGLSYVGLGTQPPQPSWGRMLNDAQTYIFRAPLLAVFPGAAITLAVLGLNLLGDGLRDRLDPRLRGR